MPNTQTSKRSIPSSKLPQEGLSGFIDGEHYFDTIADDALFEFHYNFPGWPQAVRGRANYVALYSGSATIQGLRTIFPRDFGDFS
jgi:hypothetical protein